MTNDFQMFMQQEFVGRALALLCIFGVMLVAVVTLLVYMRRRKKVALLPAAPSFAMAGMDPMDMPDLDLLVERPAPPPTPAPRQPVPPPAPPAPPVRAARKGTMVVPVLDGDATETVEVMTILRDVVDGRLIVQMGDKAYANVNNDPEFKERFTKVIRELATVAAKPASAAPTAAAPVASAEPPAAADEPEPPSLGSLMQDSASSVPTAATRATTAPPPPMVDGRMPGDLPSFRLADNPMPKLKRFQKNEVQPVPEVNLAGAIESYLQYKLQQTGAFPGRSIHIYAAPDGGVAITVDGRAYEAVGDIAETEVREFLSQTIQEWQERH